MPAQAMSPTAVPTSPNSYAKCALPLARMKSFGVVRLPQPAVGERLVMGLGVEQAVAQRPGRRTFAGVRSNAMMASALS